MSLLDIRKRLHGFVSPILSSNVLTGNISSTLTDLYEIADDDGVCRNDIAKYLDPFTPNNVKVMLEQNLQQLPPRSHQIDTDENVFDSIIPKGVSEQTLLDIVDESNPQKDG